MNNSHVQQWVSYSKLAFTSLLIYLLLFQFNLQQMRELLNLVNPSLLVAAIFLHVAAFFCGNVRWWLLLRHVEPSCPFHKIAPAYYLGLFSNNFLPTGFGGDAVRTLYLTTQGYSISKLLSSAVVDRVLGLLVLLLTGLITALVQETFTVDKSNMLILLVGALAVLLSGWLLLSPTLLNWLRTHWSSTRYQRLHRILFSLLEIFHA